MTSHRSRLRRGLTRRQFLTGAARAGAAGAVASALPLRSAAELGASAPESGAFAFSAGERATLVAALARMIPAEPPGTWSAADAGAIVYIERLLAGTSDIYAGGPTRDHFDDFQPLSRVKEIGWEHEVTRLRMVYHDGLRELDARAGGDFAALPSPAQDAILTELDFEGSPFFTALFHHTMEGVYAHPVYGGNVDYVSWRTFGYAGDVHGVRFPHEGDPGAPWNVYGGYGPTEMGEPGDEA